MIGHRSILISLTLIPALTVIIIQTLSLLKSPFAYLPPSQNHLLASVENILTGKSFYIITIGIIVAVFYIFILGPGIGSFEGHPSLQI